MALDAPRHIFVGLALVNEEAGDGFGQGDWGGTEARPFTTEVQLEVASQMGITAQRDNSSFVIALGDNFYGYGVSCENDPTPDCTSDATSHRFADTWDNVRACVRDIYRERERGREKGIGVAY